MERFVSPYKIKKIVSLNTVKLELLLRNHSEAITLKLIESPGS